MYGVKVISNRIEWIDCARGLGIILVVAGHTLLTIGPIQFQYIIFTFHMPLFLFLTTMLMKEQDWRDAAHSKVRAFIMPYFAYLLLLGLPYLAIEFVSSTRLGVEFAARLALSGTFLYGPFTAFWYLPTVYLALIVYLFLHQNLGGDKSPRFLVAISIVFAFAYVISALRITFPIPYAVHAVPAIIGLIWVGRIVPWMRRPLELTLISSVVIVAAIAFDAAIPEQSFHLDLKNALLGLPVFGIAIAIAASHMVFMLARGLSQIEWIRIILSLVGRITLPILFLHQLVHIELNQYGLQNKYVVFLLALFLPVAAAVVLRATSPKLSPYFGISARAEPRKSHAKAC